MLTFQAKSKVGNKHLGRRYKQRRLKQSDCFHLMMVAAMAYTEKTGKPCLFRAHQLCVVMRGKAHEYIPGSGFMRERFNT